MGDVTGPSNAPSRARFGMPSDRMPSRRSPAKATSNTRLDGLSLSASATHPAAHAQALSTLKRLGETPGALLKAPEGDPLTPEQAFERLCIGQEVIGRIPSMDGRARSTSALLLSLEDVFTLSPKEA